MRHLRFLPDDFTLVLIAVVVLASVLPCSGTGATVFQGLTRAAIALLFFMHGARLAREDIVTGLMHWRLHLLVFAFTFLAFPLLGVVLRPLLMPLTTPALYAGILFLCTLPGTVQSSIAFTAIARGNVPAAVCSASLSSLIGIVLSPLLVGLLLAQHGAAPSLAAVRGIVLQLLVPFIAGQIAQRWIGAWVAQHRASLSRIDRGSVLLVVYTAFSEAVVDGLWRQIPTPALLGLLLACALLLAIVLAATTWAARRLGFNREDEIAIVFCGTQKSLVTGIPMANALFAASTLGFVVLPLMIFHQMQFMACAALARRYAERERRRVLNVGSAAP